VIGVIAKLRAYKGHDDLLRAVALARRRLPELRLRLIGDGPERAGLGSLADELRLRDAVRLLGHRPDARSLFPLVDLVVLSSVMKEALPLAVIEAMAAARPVVATRVGFLDDLVVNGSTGKLVPPGDPEALAEAIVRVLEDPERARAWGLAGLARYERLFTADRMVERVAFNGVGAGADTERSRALTPVARSSSSLPGRAYRDEAAACICATTRSPTRAASSR
jgi:glycosyltransferase involved in cell wall biosynthesis